MAAATLAGLPAELLISIVKHLPTAGRCSLSAVNSQFRQILGPVLFQSFTVSSRKLLDGELGEILKKYGRHVRKLNLDLHLTPQEEFDEGDSDGKDDGEEFESIPSDRVLLDLLSGKSLRNVTAVKLTFIPRDDFNEDGWDSENSIYIHEAGETDDEVKEMEKEYTWRSTTSHVFKCVAGNQSIKDLDIVDLPPKTFSAYWSPEWQKLLNGLQSLTLKLWGGDNGAGWNSNTLSGYGEWVETLSSNFLDHLLSATRLCLISDGQNPVGCVGMNHTPIPLQPPAAPAVEHLELRHCFIDPVLVAYLETNARQLKSLRLIECFSAASADDGDFSTLAENSITWAAFFAAVREMSPVLTQLVIQNDTIPLTSDEEFARPTQDEDQQENVQAIREALKSDHRRRLFSYMYLDDKYGMVFSNEEANVKAFERGDDQREFDVLLTLVASNQASNKLLPLDESVVSTSVRFN